MLATMYNSPVIPRLRKPTSSGADRRRQRSARSLPIRSSAGRSSRYTRSLPRQTTLVRLLFFVLLGMTNLAKGLVFGTVMALAPVACFCCWNFAGAASRRYIWLWGWLVFWRSLCPGPCSCCSRQPDAVRRLALRSVRPAVSSHYLEEPRLVLFRMPVLGASAVDFAAFLGLRRPSAAPFRRGARRRSLCLVLGRMRCLVFSLSQGKHHHYMLHYLCPVGDPVRPGNVWVWQHSPRPPGRSRWRSPVLRRLSGVVRGRGFVARRLVALSSWGSPTRASIFTVLAHDTAFLRQVRRRVPPDTALMNQFRGN